MNKENGEGGVNCTISSGLENSILSREKIMNNDRVFKATPVSIFYST